jgi:hypothetical protein
MERCTIAISYSAVPTGNIIIFRTIVSIGDNTPNFRAYALYSLYPACR